jgi:hypothetical protein
MSESTPDPPTVNVAESRESAGDSQPVSTAKRQMWPGRFSKLKSGLSEKTRQLFAAVPSFVNGLFTKGNEWFGVGILVISVFNCLLTLRLVHYWSKMNVFVLVELGVVAVAFLFSGIYYKESIGTISKKIDAQNGNGKRVLEKMRLAEQSFAALNFLSFAFALWYVLQPLRHLFGIQIIYTCFAANNVLQAYFSAQLAVLDSSSGSGAVSNSDLKQYGMIRAIDLKHLYYAENWPTVFGYMFVIFGIWMLTNLIDTKILGDYEFRFPVIRDEWRTTFPDMIKALAAGVAGYHVALSTFIFQVSRKKADAKHLVEKPTEEVDTDYAAFMKGLTLRVKPEKRSVLCSHFVCLGLFALISGIFVFCWPERGVNGNPENPPNRTRLQGGDNPDLTKGKDVLQNSHPGAYD